MASIMPVRNETKSTSTRVTKEGRKLTYSLSVMQQPERARACGSGAKSSADRRPVDPPPVVELRIFEGDAMNDITFSYNANFFLFATLENARPIAQGRVPQAAPSFPILTGMPVSGMAYLDRPSPAGYFIFPDLSVRHEGKYRLGFTLYEEVKEAKDADAEPTVNPDHKSKLVNPMAPKAYVDWRLEVKSKPFTVFSAKKFPGLAESTALSRIVAEQGCRVRIRRDVRMRRREKVVEYEEYEEAEGGYVRARATPTPDPYHHQQATPIQSAHPIIDNTGRPRSPSAGSVGSRTPYGMDQHRGSVPDQAPYGPPAYPQQGGYAAAPVAPQGAAGAAYSSHLTFGAAPGPQYATPSYGASQSPAAVQPQPSYGQSQTSYFPQAPNANQYQSPQNVPSHHHMRQGSGEMLAGSRRGFMSYTQGPSSYAAPQSTPAHSYTYSEASYRPQAPPAAYPNYQNSPASGTQTPRGPTPSTTAHSLPPLKMALPVEPKSEAVSNWTNAALRSPEAEGMPSKSGSYDEHAAAAPTAAPRSSKRQYGSVFNGAQHEQSYRNGMRPSEEQTGVEAPQPAFDEDEFDNAWEIQRMKMQYKRADGTEISRRLPAVA